MTARDDLRDAFLRDAGWADAGIEWRPGDASFRRYARLTHEGARAMLMDAPPPKEQVAPFLDVAARLNAAGLSVPEVRAADRENGFLLLEDFGDATFTALLNDGADPAPLYLAATDALIRIRSHANADGLPAYDPAARTGHLSTFTDWLWPEIMGAPPTADERATLERLWIDAMERAPSLGLGFVHRDFHVDNLMRLDGRPGVAGCGVLDFQDAGYGPFAYDLASLLEDARRGLDPSVRAACVQRYLAAVPNLDAAELAAALAVHGGQRHLRVAGLWIRLWRRDGKPRYLKHMPLTLELLARSLAHPLLADVKAFLDRTFPEDARARAIGLAEQAA